MSLVLNSDSFLLDHQSSINAWDYQYCFNFIPTKLLKRKLVFDEAFSLQTVSLVLEFKNPTAANLFKVKNWFNFISLAIIRQGGSELLRLEGGENGIGTDLAASHDSVARRKIFLLDERTLVVPLPFDLVGFNNNFFDLQAGSLCGFDVILQPMIKLGDFQCDISMLKLLIQHKISHFPSKRFVDWEGPVVFESKLTNYSASVPIPFEKKARIRFVYLIIQTQCRNQQRPSVCNTSCLVCFQYTRKDGTLSRRKMLAETEYWHQALNHSNVENAMELASLPAYVVPISEQESEEILALHQNGEVSVSFDENPVENGDIRLLARVAYDCVVEREVAQVETDWEAVVQRHEKRLQQLESQLLNKK